MSAISNWDSWANFFMLLTASSGSLLFAGGTFDNSITIVYNNVPGDMVTGLQVAGGFSAFIVFDRQKILFDTGGDAAVLLGNINALELELGKMDAVVISHNHWDHIYGLPVLYYLAEPVPKVYVPGSSRDSVLRQNPRLDIVPVDEPFEILPNVWSSGVMKTSYRNITLHEQSLILDGDRGLHVITGCAHPGIVKIIERVREVIPERPIALVAGGFHLVNASERDVRDISARLKELGVTNIAPSHCTGGMAMDIFRKEWGKNFIELYLGYVCKF
ncbi:MAG: MBL fold metallo-hydrolase [candidate division WOR-3 bacterium]|nr:MAG: MBL fold metallo-hydrolase [candidate division WOR-3 bacterium]